MSSSNGLPSQNPNAYYNTTNGSATDSMVQASNNAGLASAGVLGQLLSQGGPKSSDITGYFGANGGFDPYGAAANAGNATAAFQGQLGQANQYQQAALSGLQNAAAGNGPSLASLMQQRALGQGVSQAQAMMPIQPGRSGSTGDASFQNALRAMGSGASNTIAAGGDQKLNEMNTALGQANSLAGLYTSNLQNAANTGFKGTLNVADQTNNALSNNFNARNSAQGLGNSYLAMLGNIATGGASNSMNQAAMQSNFNNSLAQGGANMLASWSASNQEQAKKQAQNNG